MLLLLTFWLLFTEEALGHFSEEFLGRAGGVELWHHHTAAWGKLIRGETLEEKRKKERQEDEEDARRTKNGMQLILSKKENASSTDAPQYSVLVPPP